MKTKIFKAIVSLCIAGFISLAADITSQAAPVTMADGNLFDAQYYATAYPDVVAVFGTDANMLYLHYVLAGKAEGRLPYAAGTATTVQTAPGMITLPDGTLFDPVFYATAYPDVAAVFGADPNMLATHYMLCGKAEGRLPYGNNVAQPLVQTPVPTASVPGTYNGMVITDANWYTVPLDTLIDMGNYLYFIYDTRVHPDFTGPEYIFLSEAEGVLLTRYPQLNTPIRYGSGYVANNAVLAWPNLDVYRYSPSTDKNLKFCLYYGSDHSNIPGITFPDFVQFHH